MKTKLAVGAALVAVLVVVATRLLGVWGGGASSTHPTTGSSARSGDLAIPTPTRAASPPVATSGRAHDDDPDGDIRLEGQVIDGSDQPVAGARVAIDANPPKQAIADASGNFVFEGLIARDYRLEATAAAGYAGPAYVRLTAKPEPVTLRLHPARAVDVVVTSAASGEPVGNADVELRATVTYAAKTDAKGVAHLANVGGVFAPLSVKAAGFAVAQQMLAVSGDPGTPVRVAVALVTGATIAGRVVDDAKHPVAGALVIASDAGTAFPVADARADAVVTAADGTFTTAPVAAGTWRITATAGTFAPATSSPIIVDGMQPKAGVELVLAAGATITGKVVDKANDAPVAGAAVRVIVHGFLDWRAQRQAFTAADGTFAIAGLPRRDVDVVASHKTGASAVTPVDLAAKPSAQLTLALAVTGAITGTVVDQAGQGLGDAQVVAEPVFDGGTTDRAAWSVRGPQATVTDQGGAFAFAGLPDGSYRVRAARPGAPESALDLATPTEAKPNGPPLRIVVTADGKITGKVALEAGGAPASFTVALGDAFPTPFASADGTFTISAPAGAQTIVVDGKKFLASKARSVTVAPNKTTDVGTITVEPGRSVSGRVLDATGAAVAGAQVAAGALLTGGGKDLYIAEESVGAKATVTDADGRYRLEGFSPVAITIVAGKDGVGRAPSVRLPAGDDSASIDLVLAKTTGLDGTITRDGKPLGDAVVIANPIGAASSNFFTSTGPDGTFALDALSPGAYLVYPMIGGGGPRPKDMFIVRTDLVDGTRTHVAIDVTAGPVTLTATFKTDAGAPVMFGGVFLVAATIDPKSTNELRAMDQLDVFGDKPIVMSTRTLMLGAPVEIAGVAPGDHTLCLVLVNPANPSPGPGASMPLKCQAVKVGAAPAQAVELVVPAALVPK